MTEITVYQTDKKTPKKQRAKAAKDKIENQMVAASDKALTRTEERKQDRLERKRLKQSIR